MKPTLESSVLTQVQRPGRYIGGEPGQVVKDPASVEVRFALCFPDAYEIGMSHLGLRILYSRLNSDPRIWCERSFAPMADMESALRRASLPLTTLESRTPLSDLDVLGFSLQHELCITNVLLMLDLGGVPLRASDRRDNDPLIVAGGPTACHPEAFAPFFDAFALGDGEELAGQIATTWVTSRNGGATRNQALEELDQIPSVYVPGLADVEEDRLSHRLVVIGGTRAKASRIDDLNAFAYPSDGPVPITEAVFDRAMVEIARGCGGGCRFCQAGMVYRPVRERDPRAIMDCLQQQLVHGGYDEASLTSLSTADYSQIGPLLKSASQRLSDQRVALSVSSLRAHGLDESLTEALAAVRTTSLTLAPEAATQRLRDVINKNITEDDIIRGAQASMIYSRRRLKLYFMIGLPTETDDDVESIAALAGRIQRAVAGRSKRRLALTVSASTFIPKPHTPLQWCEAIGREEVLYKHKVLKSLLKPLRIEGRFHDVKLSVLEAILARADRRAADLAESAYRRGARFDGWDEHFNVDAWRAALDEWGVDPDLLRAPIPLDARLPWDHLDVGPNPAYLRREYRRALASKTTSPCLRIRADGEGELVCHKCGVDCDLEAERGRYETRAQSANAIAPQAAEAQTPTEPSAARYRLIIEKRDRLIWLGHLDTVRLLTRLFRRAGASLTYSKGFHPKPKLSFASPLPLGMAGLGEVVDVTLDEAPTPVEPATLLEAMQRLSPRGLNIKELRPLQDAEPAATRSLVGAELLVVSREFPDDLERRLEAAISSERLEVDRPKRGLVDLRQALINLQPCLDHELLAIDGESARGVLARVALGQGPSIRTEDLLAWSGWENGSCRAYRLKLLRDPIPTPLG